MFHQFVCARVFTCINIFVCIGKNRSSIKRQLQSTNQAFIMFFFLRCLKGSNILKTGKILLSCFSTTLYKSLHKSSHPAFIDLNSIGVALGLTLKTVIKSPPVEAFSLSHVNIIWTGLRSFLFALTHASLFSIRKDVVDQKTGKCLKWEILSRFFCNNVLGGLTSWS